MSFQVVHVYYDYFFFKNSFHWLLDNVFGWAQPELEGCVWTEFFHEDGALASEGCLVNGLPVGLWTNFDQEGNTISKGERVNNQPHGVWQFFEEGFLKEEATFKAGVKEGAQTFWVDGIMTDSVTWVQGKKEGWAFRFVSDGHATMKMPYKQDQKEGKAITFNAQGKPHGTGGSRTTGWWRQKISIGLMKMV